MFRVASQRIRKSAFIRKSFNSTESFANSQSSEYMEAMYQAWTEDPKSVHVSWQAYFSNVSKGVSKPFTAPPTLFPVSETIDFNASKELPSGDILDSMKVQLMVRAYQVRGHQLANLDPLGINFIGNQEAPELEPSHYGFTEADLDRKFYLGAGILPRFINNGGQTQMTLREIQQALKNTYCGSIGIEYGHIPDRHACEWLRSKFEVPSKYNYTKEQKKVILDRLMWSDHFERFVAAKYPSEKRFGLEGAESLVPGMKALVNILID